MNRVEVTGSIRPVSRPCTAKRGVFRGKRTLGSRLGVAPLLHGLDDMGRPQKGARGRDRDSSLLTADSMRF
jgi:hypothetical protein